MGGRVTVRESDVLPVGNRLDISDDLQQQLDLHTVSQSAGDLVRGQCSSGGVGCSCGWTVADNDGWRADGADGADGTHLLGIGPNARLGARHGLRCVAMGAGCRHRRRRRREVAAETAVETSEASSRGWTS